MVHLTMLSTANIRVSGYGILSKNVKVRIHKTIILPVVLYGRVEKTA
jgi:hypothetical protein